MAGQNQWRSGAFSILRYMEDITSTNQPDKRPWIKTLQGLAIGIQCIGGEMPFLFFSGHIIKRIGHWHCMTLGLFAFAVRFHLYSIITDPVWILPVELINGITFGLSHSVLMAYAKSIAPVSAVTTVLSFSGSLFEGVGEFCGSSCWSPTRVKQDPIVVTFRPRYLYGKRLCSKAKP